MNRNALKTGKRSAFTDVIQNFVEVERSGLATGMLYALMTCVCLDAISVKGAGNPPELAAHAMSVFRDSCLSCHNAEKAKGGLIMETREALMRGSDSGLVVVSGKPEESYLLETLTDTGDAHMPPKKQLETSTIAQLTEWIRVGMPWDSDTLHQSPVIRPQDWRLQSLPTNYHPVLAIAVNDADDWLVSSQGAALILTRMEKENPVQSRLPDVHTEAIRALAVSPDGKHWVSGGFGRLVLWDSESREKVREYTDGLSGQINAIQFTRDGSLMLVAEGLPGLFGNMHVYANWNDPAEHKWQAHSDEVYDIQESYDGSYWMTASADHTIRLWESDTWIEQDWLEGHSAPVMGLTLNGDGSLLVSAGSDQALKVWDMYARERLFDLGRGHAFSLLDVCWEPEKSQLFAINQRGDLYRYLDLKAHSGAQSSATGQEKVMARTKKPLSCLTYWKRQESLVVGSFEGELQAFDLNGKSKWTLPPYGSATVEQVSH